MSNIEIVLIGDIKDTKWSGGWLSPNGVWYPACLMGHVSLAFDLEELKIIDPRGLDVEYFLEKNGWLKISGGSVYYSNDKKPSKKMVDALFDYMNARNETSLMINRRRTEMKDVISLNWSPVLF